MGMARRFGLTGLFAAAALQVACASAERNRVRTAAALDHKCPEEEVQIVDAKSDIHFVLAVCGSRREYVYFNEDKIKDVTGMGKEEKGELVDDDWRDTVKDTQRDERAIERFKRGK